MKKILVCIGIILALIAAFLIGNYRGKMHVLETGVFYIVDFDAVSFDGNEYDASLYIELDGDLYVQGLYIG